jgi:hypothetical protein
MPRAKKSPKLDAPQDSHGERAELSRLQEQAPTGPAGSAAPPPASATPSAAGSSSPRDPAQVLRMAQSQMPARGLGLGDPSTRPTEPVTAGAPIGPGPGPQGTPGKAAKILGRMAAMSDDPKLTELARRAAMKGL